MTVGERDRVEVIQLCLKEDILPRLIEGNERYLSQKKQAVRQ